jgi:hypothetical protein
MEIKYIRIEKDIIIFPETIVHLDVARSFGRSNVISAGFISFDFNGKGEHDCYGESTSLNLKSLPEDTQLLRRQLNPYM